MKPIYKMNSKGRVELTHTWAIATVGNTQHLRCIHSGRLYKCARQRIAGHIPLILAPGVDVDLARQIEVRDSA